METELEDRQKGEDRLFPSEKITHYYVRFKHANMWGPSIVSTSDIEIGLPRIKFLFFKGRHSTILEYIARAQMHIYFYTRRRISREVLEKELTYIEERMIFIEKSLERAIERASVDERQKEVVKLLLYYNMERWFFLRRGFFKNFKKRRTMILEEEAH